jgi:hypothetical protein
MEQLMVEGLSNVQAGVIAMTSAEIYYKLAALNLHQTQADPGNPFAGQLRTITPPMKSVSCQTPTGQPEEPNWPGSKTKTHHCVTTKKKHIHSHHRSAAGRGKPV